ncbi:MAG: hypothetical protein KAT48_14690 [Bacteroidales bacterium]|nr:hypothetical protein [Bacteroidales bacterium]
MKEKVNNIDFFISSLVRKSTREKAPAGFTDNLMKRIETEVEQETVTSQPLVSRNMWILIIAGFAVVISLVFFIDWSFLGLNISSAGFDVQYFENLIVYFKSTVEWLTFFFAFFTSSSLPAIIAVGIISLLIIDKILRRFTLHKTYLF